MWGGLQPREGACVHLAVPEEGCDLSWCWNDGDTEIFHLEHALPALREERKADAASWWTLDLSLLIEVMVIPS